MTAVTPETLEQLAEAVKTGGPFDVVGSDSKAWMRPVRTSPKLRLTKLSGIVQHDVDDQVVVVRAGTTLAELQSELAKTGQCLPLPDPRLGAPASGFQGTVGGLIASNLPHVLSAQHGGPREWVLGLTVVRADCTVFKCGSKAVKSVAGFDVHKLMTGSRGTLGVIAQAILRTWPLRAVRVPEHSLEIPYTVEPLWIQRVLRSDFDRAREGLRGRLFCSDPASCTLWAEDAPYADAPRYPEDWVIRSGGRVLCAEHEQPVVQRMHVRAKEIFDHEGKLNPGEWVLG